jgi:purine-binding chemotaxis protein CheW
MTESKLYCSFLVGDLFVGVDVRIVQEMIRYQEMTRVQLAAREMSGLINLRGQIVPAIDLRRRLGLEDRKDGALPMNVVIRTTDGVISFLVDEIGDVLEVEPGQFEHPPETLSGTTRELIEGVYKLKDKLLLILNTEKAAILSGMAA